MKIGYLVIKHFDDGFISIPDTVFDDEEEAYEYRRHLNETDEDGELWEVDQVRVEGF